MYSGVQVKYPLLLSDFNETWILSTDFRKKKWNMKFHEDPSSESRVVPCRQADGRPDMMKMIFDFRNFANAPKNGRVILLWQTLRPLNVTMSSESICLETDLLAGCREHDNVPSGSIKTGGQILLTGERLFAPVDGVFFMRRTKEVLTKYDSVWY